MEKGDSVLVLAAGSLGDCVLTLPALQTLQAQAQVTLAGTFPYRQLGPGLLGVDQVLPLEPLLQGLFSSSGEFNGQSFWDGFKEVFMFFKEPDEKLHSKLSSFPSLKVRQPAQAFEDFLKQERWAGEYWLEFVRLPDGSLNPGAPQARLIISAELKKRGQEIFETMGLESPFVIHPGSGSPSKNAPLSFFQKAAEKIAGETGKRVLVAWGEAEEGTLKEIQGVFSSMEKVQVLPQPLPLADLAAVLSQACGYLGNDSGVTQLASACGVKTFAVFNQTDSRIWGPQEGFILEALKTLYP